MAKRPPSSLHHGAQFGRDDGHYDQDHPPGFVAALAERFHHFQALDQPGFLWLSVTAPGYWLNSSISPRRSAASSSGRRTGAVLLPPRRRYPPGSCRGRTPAALLVLVSLRIWLFSGCFALVQHDVGGKVQYLLQVLGDVQQHAHAAGMRQNTRCGSRGLPSRIWPMRSRRTLDLVTSTPHLSHIILAKRVRLYLPQ